MPYKNIVWVKLEKQLLNDHRFFTLSETSQLYYIKILLLCAETNNKIPRKYPILKALLRTEYKESELDKIIEDIKKNFPKLLLHKDFYYIKGFKSKHNWIKQGSSLGVPKEDVDKRREERDKDKDKNRELLQTFSDLHKEVVGIAYAPNFGKDKKLLYGLMDIYDIKTLNSLIEGFFDGAKDPNEWWFDKTLSIGMLKTLIPQVITRIRRNK